MKSHPIKLIIKIIMDGRLILLTSGTVRKNMLERVVVDACSNFHTMTLMNLEEIKEEKNKKDIKYIIIDLPNVRGSAKKIISDTKKILPDTAIIGIHFYLNKKLIQPLMDSGLNGYLLYNPNKSDFINAMKEIDKGKKYLPSQIQ
ncbi:MAG: hypothetical protein ACFCU6_09000 [Balneolaceae bacterium]